ncbi:MAG: ATP-binding cassette domain-containing protein [Clostridia bacterium]|nr:ATP-binding cassette domain-containing protein [Clostridia bacterium]
MSIQFDHFSFQYDGAEKPALKDVSLVVEQGEFVVLAGNGGSGKSTLIHCINGVIPGFIKGNIEGTLTVNGMDTRKVRTVELTKKVGVVFQNAEMQFFTTTVEEELALALENMGVPRDTILERIAWALEMTGLEAFRTRPLYALSGGQKQLVAIASILVMQPDILLLDEPTANLDPMGSEKVYRCVRDIQRKLGSTIILIDHKIDMIIENIGADFRMIALKDGQLIADGKSCDVLTDIPLIDDIGLKVLPTVELWDALRQKGIDVPPFLTVAGGVEILSKFRGKE